MSTIIFHFLTSNYRKQPSTELKEPRKLPEPTEVYIFYSLEQIMTEASTISENKPWQYIRSCRLNTPEYSTGVLPVSWSIWHFFSSLVTCTYTNWTLQIKPQNMRFFWPSPKDYVFMYTDPECVARQRSHLAPRHMKLRFLVVVVVFKNYFRQGLFVPHLEKQIKIFKTCCWLNKRESNTAR